MNFIVAPEPADWLEPLVRSLRSSGEATIVHAPWAVPTPPPAWVPPRIATPWRRRLCDLDSQGANPAWWLADAALRAWGGASVDRVLTARVLRREACDRLAAMRLPADATTVYAPSLSARRVFSRAKQRGLRTVLVEDLPSLCELHEDLDDAWTRWPQADFLRRFRAPAGWVAEQRAERQLADQLLVRTGYARRLRLAEGRRDVAWLPGYAPAPIAPEPVRRPARTVLLAGLANARHGTYDVLAALDGRPDVTLLVNPGEGLAPEDLLSRPGVRIASAEQRERLVGVDLVVAPAWCESAPRELEAARGCGVPVLASNRAGTQPDGPAPRDMVEAIRAALA